MRSFSELLMVFADLRGRDLHGGRGGVFIGHHEGDTDGGDCSDKGRPHDPGDVPPADIDIVLDIQGSSGNAERLRLSRYHLPASTTVLRPSSFVSGASLFLDDDDIAILIHGQW
jgi:hypothetical protein